MALISARPLQWLWLRQRSTAPRQRSTAAPQSSRGELRGRELRGGRQDARLVDRLFSPPFLVLPGLTRSAVVQALARTRHLLCARSRPVRGGAGWAAGLCGQLAGTALVVAAGGRPTRARPARPRWPRVREADRARCSFSSRPGCPRHGCPRAQPPSALAPRVPPGAMRAARQRRAAPPGGHRVFDLRAQQRSRKCCSALPLAALSCCCCSAFFSCNGSLAVSPSTLCLSVPPSSFLRPPLSLPSPCFSAFSPSLSFFLSARVSLCAVPTSLCGRGTTSPCTRG